MPHHKPTPLEGNSTSNYGKETFSSLFCKSSQRNRPINSKYYRRERLLDELQNLWKKFATRNSERNVHLRIPMLLPLSLYLFSRSSDLYFSWLKKLPPIETISKATNHQEFRPKCISDQSIQSLQGRRTYSPRLQPSWHVMTTK